MLCDNCKKNEANVRYYENINGEKKELKLCEECSKKLGINKKMNFDFSMPIDFSNFFGGSRRIFQARAPVPSFTIIP